MCDPLQTELRTLARVATHTEPEDIDRRITDHTRWCRQCSPSTWQPATGLPRDPDQETTWTNT